MGEDPVFTLLNYRMLCESYYRDGKLPLSFLLYIDSDSGTRDVIQSMLSRHPLIACPYVVSLFFWFKMIRR